MPPSEMVRRVPIFVSSPSDLLAERAAVGLVLEKLNQLSTIKALYHLEPLLYEYEVLPEQGDFAQMIVDRYMQVQDSYLVICMLWARMGTPFVHPRTGELFQSGTEYEFNTAYQTNLASGKPYLFLYRKTGSAPQADADQKAKVDVFFQQFVGAKPRFKGLYKSFESTSEFEEMLFHHIEKLLSKYLPSPIQPSSDHPMPATVHSTVKIKKAKGNTIISGVNNSTININQKEED
ncbi:MAG: hypothetical protein K8L97_08990 [Anaerolineae bacterium]|nr:hypothetical protein [Anaerolineae bacterium]